MTDNTLHRLMVAIQAALLAACIGMMALFFLFFTGMIKPYTYWLVVAGVTLAASIGRLLFTRLSSP